MERTRFKSTARHQGNAFSTILPLFGSTCVAGIRGLAQLAYDFFRILRPPLLGASLLRKRGQIAALRSPAPALEPLRVAPADSYPYIICIMRSVIEGVALQPSPCAVLDCSALFDQTRTPPVDWRLDGPTRVPSRALAGSVTLPRPATCRRAGPGRSKSATSCSCGAIRPAFPMHLGHVWRLRIRCRQQAAHER